MSGHGVESFSLYQVRLSQVKCFLSSFHSITCIDWNKMFPQDHGATHNSAVAQYTGLLKVQIHDNVRQV